LLAELASVSSSDEAAEWVHKRLAAKNTLSAADASLVEGAFARRLAQIGCVSEVAVTASSATAVCGDEHGKSMPSGAEMTTSPREDAQSPPAWLGPADPELRADPPGIDKSALLIGAPRRFRDKAHLAFVASQPCLLCGKRPVDPHHIRFAQKQSLGRKVSDEFTVPLCRSHHRALHRSGSEYLWWENVGIDPLKAARKLWKKTRMKGQRGATDERQAARASGARAVTPPATTAAETPKVRPHASEGHAATLTHNPGSDHP
jgi:hypothetical protein